MLISSYMHVPLRALLYIHHLAFPRFNMYRGGRSYSKSPQMKICDGAGPGNNVAQDYARFADAMQSGAAGSPDFDHAVVRHALIDAMERSHEEGRVVKLA